MSTVNPPKKWTTKLSSAGLVYCHFGREIVSKILELSVEDPITDVVYDKVYENFVEEIDAIDNGINQYDGEPRWFYYPLRPFIKLIKVKIFLNHVWTQISIG